MLCIAGVIPLCQEGSHFRVLALCKGWVCDLFPVLLCNFTAVWTASLSADPVIGCCTPLVTTDLTEPTNMLSAVCHNTVRCAIVCFVVPLSRN